MCLQLSAAVASDSTAAAAAQPLPEFVSGLRCCQMLTAENKMVVSKEDLLETTVLRS